MRPAMCPLIMLVMLLLLKCGQYPLAVGSKYPSIRAKAGSDL